MGTDYISAEEMTRQLNVLKIYVETLQKTIEEKDFHIENLRTAYSFCKEEAKKQRRTLGGLALAFFATTIMQEALLFFHL